MSESATPSDPEPVAPARGEEHFLSRSFLQSGGIAALVAREAPAQRVLTDAERAESLQAVLAERPRGDAWLFGYGSLIWNPTVHSVERRVARVIGWHRSFCLSVRVGRGSLDRPGLVLALDSGGECTGVAYRIEEAVLHTELELLWRREMVSGSYVPRWISVHDAQGEAFGSALAFTMNTGCEQYAGHLDEEQVIERLATATGVLGSSADYLFRTCEGLHACGVPDTDLERLRALVTALQAKPC